MSEHAVPYEDPPKWLSVVVPCFDGVEPIREELDALGRQGAEHAPIDGGAGLGGAARP